MKNSNIKMKINFNEYDIFSINILSIENDKIKFELTNEYDGEYYEDEISKEEFLKLILEGGY